MALSKQKKDEVVAELKSLLSDSKMTVVAEYKGTTVKAIQSLRKEAKANGTKISVVKNRLVIKALDQIEGLKSVETGALKGQLLYAFNSNDEVAPAKVIAEFGKKNPNMQFVGAITAEGTFVGADEVKALASLPSKNELIAGVINILGSPVNNVMGGLKGNLHGLLQAIEAKASN